MEGDKHYKHCVLPDYAENLRQRPEQMGHVARVPACAARSRSRKAFNQPINSGARRAVTDMDEMFSGKVSDQEATGFNQPIENWDVSHVKTMERMFKDAAVFNQPLHKWRTASVTSLQETFKDAISFNQPLPWDVSKVTNAAGIFRDAASFDQNLGWCLESGVNLGLAFSMAPCESTNCGVQVSPNCTTSQSHHHHDTEGRGPVGGPSS